MERHPGTKLLSSKKRKPEGAMPQRFRPIAVNNTEVASAGGLVPVKDEEVDGLAADRKSVV